MKKPKIIWVNFLHMYQPPWQSRGMIEKIAITSYDYLFTLLEKYPNFKFSLNITGSLIEQLEIIRPDLLERLKIRVRRGQIELTGSAKYHALLPLLASTEIKRQIKLNQEVLAKHFNLQKIKGFYFPEMAYSLEAARIVKNLGFRWLILDEIHFNHKVDNDILYEIKNLGLEVIFRNRMISKSYPAEVIYKKLAGQRKFSEVIITATDAEIYGHQHEDWQGHLEKIFLQQDLQMSTVSQYLKTLTTKKIVALHSASWESTPQELKNKIPFALWHHPRNKIHRDLWALVNLAVVLLNKYKKDKNWFWAQQHLDRGLSSCSFWWATAQKPSVFSPLTWNPEMIDNGSEELIRVGRSLERATSREKIKAEEIYLRIKKNTWFTHWQKYHK
jgi:predicted glycosyl hydrolase (DUF1957 family)